MIVFLVAKPRNTKKTMIYQGDVFSSLRILPDNFYHGCLSDPPYALTFMDKTWDASLPSIEVWRELYRVLRPGAFILIYGGTRTYFRLGCNIEDAGFNILNTLAWAYGSGFPKAHKVELEDWEGYKTPHLKPAFEPIILGQKPIEGTYKQNAIKWGCGLLNIDACRINGRFPSNLILNEASAAELDVQASNKSYKSKKPFSNSMNSYHGGLGQYNEDAQYDDEGGVSRYYQIIYCKKASAKERNAGLDDLPIKPIDGRPKDCGGWTRDNKGLQAQRNIHPCVKPLELNKYLARLILPPGASNLIVPYAGVFSEVIGAEQAGWKNIDCIEMDGEYIEIGKRRLDYFENLIEP